MRKLRFVPLPASPSFGNRVHANSPALSKGRAVVHTTLGAVLACSIGVTGVLNAAGGRLGASAYAQEAELGQEAELSQEAVPGQEAEPGVEQPTDGPASQLGQAPASPELAQLIEEVGRVAREVAAKGEEVKQLEDDIAASEKELIRLKAKAQAAKRAAAEADAAVEAQQGAIDELAQSRYRGDSRHPVVAALAAKNANDAVERLGYLGAISRVAQRNLDSRAVAAATARDKRELASEAVEEALAKQAALDDQRDKLLAEQRELEADQRGIEKQVDSLSQQERAAWENQFNPLDKVDISTLDPAAASGVVAAALSKQGAPYGWGHAGPDSFDCSGLMLWAYQQMGMTIPRTSQAQIAGGQPVSIDDLQPGDIVGYYPGVTHVGMYIGNGQIVHASTYGVPVQVVPVDSMPITAASRY